MKTSTSIVAVFLLAAILTFWADTSHAGTGLWPNSKGEVCLLNVDTGGLAALAVVRVIGSHYAVQGIVTDIDGEKTLVDGNAEVDGTQILIHISASGYGNGEVHGMNGIAELNASTLTGTFVAVSFHCEGDPAANPPDCGFSYDGVQELEPVSCP